MESEQQATNELMSQKTSAIDLRRWRQQLYYSGQKPYSPVLSSVDPAEAAERKRLTAEEGLQALDKNLCAGTVAKTLKLNGKNR
jgi:hypothetical protein